MLESDKDRFWSKVSFTANPNVCWEWNRPIKDGLRPQFWVNTLKRSINSNRIAYYLHYKKQPSELIVCHSCDNPKCCNPNHLWLGTDNDNMQDMIKKGRDRKACGDDNGARKKPERVARGERQGLSKLKELDILKIRFLKNTSDISNRKLAKLFSVSPSCIDDIVNRKKWSHI